jgi:hypothetical protein
MKTADCLTFALRGAEDCRTRASVKESPASIAESWQRGGPCSTADRPAYARRGSQLRTRHGDLRGNYLECPDAFFGCLLGTLTAGIVLTVNYLENRKAAASSADIDSDAVTAEK